MTEKPKQGPKGAEAFAGIGEGMGGLLGALSDALSDMLAAAGKSGAGGTQSFDTGPDGPLRAAGQVRVRMGGLGDAAPRGTPAGRNPARPVNPGRAATPDPAPAASPPPSSAPSSPPPVPPADAAPRAPRFESAETAEAWVLIAELPGVADGELSISLAGGRLVLETTGARRYRAEAPAPAGSDPARLETRLANGILEVRLPRGPAPA